MTQLEGAQCSDRSMIVKMSHHNRMPSSSRSQDMGPSLLCQASCSYPGRMELQSADVSVISSDEE